MAKVHLLNIVVLDNPSPFLNPFQFQITFECLEELPHDLEWKMIYVGSAESDVYDQVLDTIYVGPVPEGRNMFVFHADPPDTSKIPVADVLGVTVVLLTCSYMGQEFVRVGYFTNNDYEDVELRENPPAQPIFSKIIRNILATQPRVTRFNINWGENKEGEEKENEQPTTSNNVVVNENTVSMDETASIEGKNPSMISRGDCLGDAAMGIDLQMSEGNGDAQMTDET